MHRPTVTYPGTWRDKNETARRAAFPQPGGRFCWWWQIQGSNLGRRSRRLAIAQENKHSGWRDGFRHRLKDENRLLEKVAEGLTTSSPDATPREVRRLIPDAIRFTYCFQPENYTRGYDDIRERFESRGHEMYYSRNYWTDPEYKGINTRWVTAEEQRFEVQFHTPHSFHAKHEVTYLAYERIRDTSTSRAELRELHAFQREVSSWIEVPDGAADIPDIKKEGF